MCIAYQPCTLSRTICVQVGVIFAYSLELDHADTAISNMLTISFGTRTDTATDPLVEKVLAMAMDFMDLTGNVFLPHRLPFQFSITRIMVQHNRLY